MPITAEQRQARQKHIGSSDIAPILGIENPGNRNAADIYYEKTEGVSAFDDNSSEAMEAGNRFEGALLDWAQDELGHIARNAEITACDVDFPLVVHADGVVSSTLVPVEAKTSGLFGPLHRHWGDSGTDDVPIDVVAQCQALMKACQQEVCHVVAFLGGRGFTLYHINRDEELLDAVMGKVAEFWSKHVEPRVPPPDDAPSIAVLKRLRRQPDKVVPINDELVAAWSALREKRLEIEKLEKAAHAGVVHALGDAEGGSLEDGSLVTYLRYTVQRFQTKRFREKHPTLAKQFTEPSEYRMLKLKKVKPVTPRTLED